MSKGEPIRLGLMGARGRMGRMVAGLLESGYGARARLTAAWTRDNPPSPPFDCDAIIDFSSPAGSLALLDSAPSGELPPLACGATGWQPGQMARLRERARAHRVLLASNFSMGIAILTRMLREYAPLLLKLGYAPVITETHHRHKKDAPSGTALALREAISPQDPDAVQTHSIRAGEVVGEHRLQFFGPVDQMTWLHEARDRSLFARGAVEAALWLAHAPKTERLLGMDDLFEDLLARGRPRQEPAS